MNASEVDFMAASDAERAGFWCRETAASVVAVAAAAAARRDQRFLRSELCGLRSRVYAKNIERISSSASIEKPELLI